MELFCLHIFSSFFFLKQINNKTKIHFKTTLTAELSSTFIKRIIGLVFKYVTLLKKGPRLLT